MVLGAVGVQQCQSTVLCFSFHLSQQDSAGTENFHHYCSLVIFLPPAARYMKGDNIQKSLIRSVGCYIHVFFLDIHFKWKVEDFMESLHRSHHSAVNPHFPSLFYWRFSRRAKCRCYFNYCSYWMTCQLCSPLLPRWYGGNWICLAFLHMPQSDCMLTVQVYHPIYYCFIQSG